MTENQQSTIDAPISSERIMSTLREQLSAINATVDRQEASVVTQVQLEAGLLPPPSSNAASRVSTSSFWPKSCHAREGS